MGYGDLLQAHIHTDTQPSSTAAQQRWYCSSINGVVEGRGSTTEDR